MSISQSPLISAVSVAVSQESLAMQSRTGLKPKTSFTAHAFAAE
jgi:hypothetical protein